MMMLWAWAGIPLGAYNIVKNFNVALQVQPQILTVLSLVTWIQCYHYQKVSNYPFELEINTDTFLEMVDCPIFNSRRAHGQLDGWR